ncbi:DNA polymerase-1 [Marininema halotolerans]|uniref:DNA polymerase-1 n=1 Tax=Marininema halotolerans TaxID=1155944 RepID=A0A1I6TUL7_9BACL|nr:DNA polymerase [Marininema halotolerans]SFS92922.1 DNA polymerase-1 [Marininema halotolerans]
MIREIERAELIAVDFETFGDEKGKLVFKLEMLVAREFIKADLRGIRFDTYRAKELDKTYAEEEEKLKKDIFRLLGEEINLNSPAQLSKKLYVDLRLPDVDNGLTGVRTLKKLSKKHEVMPKLLEYREVGKSRQAFTTNYLIL